MSEAWDDHYIANLYFLPFPGLDPADLKHEAQNHDTLESLLTAHPEARRDVEFVGINTLEELFEAQEKAYRESAYESYADKFATDFLLRNAKKLNIPTLQQETTLAA